jgi:diguanylate cyclase (GGDEF)-like protein
MLSESPELWKRHRLIDVPLLGSVLAVSVIIWSHRTEHLVLLHLYYLPVIIAGFYLGRSSAGILSLFCILTGGLALFATRPSEAALSLQVIVAFTFWAATLGLTAILIGTLSDAGRRALHQLGEAHKEEIVIDPLTRVLNRRGLEHDIAQRMMQHEVNNSPDCLAIIDIDHFKHFNDRYGHQTGDAILAAVAQTLKRVLRDNDSIARYGGEEFALLLSSDSLEQNQQIAERMRTTIESTVFEHDGLKHRLTVSIGMAQIMQKEDISAVFQRADAALYCSKESGRNCAHHHNGSQTHPFGDGLVVLEIDVPEHKLMARQPQELYGDETTGLPTLKVFVEEFRRRAAEAQRYDFDMTLALIAVRDYRESYDQRAQNHVLRTVARLIGSVIRESDLVARYSQNQFCVLLPWTSHEQSMIPLGRLQQNAAAYKDAQYAHISFEVAIGVAQVLAGDHAGAVFQRAENDARFLPDLESQISNSFQTIMLE